LHVSGERLVARRAGGLQGRLQRTGVTEPNPAVVHGPLGPLRTVVRPAPAGKETMKHPDDSPVGMELCATLDCGAGAVKAPHQTAHALVQDQATFGPSRARSAAE